MDVFNTYLKQFDIVGNVTDEEVEKALALLQIYGSTLRRAGSSLADIEEHCFEAHRKSISDFIDLSVDFDQEADRRRIAERLTGMGHSMQLLSILEEALNRVKADPKTGRIHYDILRARFFDAYCASNEEAYLNLGISSSTYYRHIKKAIRAFAAQLWCVVIPDLVISEKMKDKCETDERQCEIPMKVS